MGGPGSGRRQGKQTLDNLIRADLRVLHRKGALVPGCISLLRYTKKGRHIGTITVTVAENRTQVIIELTQVIKQMVRISYTSCHFGGQRPWFHCPKCNRRVLVLYPNPYSFKCRHCYSLTYKSRNEAQIDLLLRRTRLIRDKLFASPDISTPIPPRPKGMHETTYWRLRLEAELKQRKVFGLMNDRLSQPLHDPASQLLNLGVRSG